MPRHTILFLAANPAGTVEVNLTKECSEIEDELSRTPHHQDFEVKSQWAASVDDVMRCLNKLQPTVMHFSGHGNARHGLIFEDAHGGAQPVAPTALARIVAAAGKNVRLVVLNACYADEQARALSARVECVVGMSGTVLNDDARAYSAGFYRALGYRKTIADAHQQGIANVHGRRPDGDVPGITRDVASTGDDPPDPFAPVLLTRADRTAEGLTLWPPRSSRRPGARVRGLVVLGLLIAIARLAWDPAPSGPSDPVGVHVDDARARVVPLDPVQEISKPVVPDVLVPDGPSQDSGRDGPELDCWVYRADVTTARYDEPECSRCVPSNSPDVSVHVEIKSFPNCKSLCVCR